MVKSKLYAGLLLSLCLAVGVGCKNTTSFNESTTMPTENRTSLGTSKVVESGYFLDKRFLNEQGDLSKKYEYVLFSSANSSVFTKLNDRIKDVLDKQNLSFTNSDSPVDPHNAKLIYISGFQQDALAQKLVNKIYSLNLETNELQELFSRQDTPEEHKIGLTLRIIGREESKIIVKSDNINNPPGDCDTDWTDSQANFSYLDINEVSKGLQNYTVPKELIDQAEKEKQECLKGKK
jgi:hypothetical protein